MEGHILLVNAYVTCAQVHIEYSRYLTTLADY